MLDMCFSVLSLYLKWQFLVVWLTNYLFTNSSRPPHPTTNHHSRNMHMNGIDELLVFLASNEEEVSTLCCVLFINVLISTTFTRSTNLMN